VCVILNLNRLYKLDTEPSVCVHAKEEYRLNKHNITIDAGDASIEEIISKVRAGGIKVTKHAPVEYTVRIEPDTDAQNPIEEDRLVRLLCFHKKYTLGHAHPGLKQEDFDNWDRVKQALTETYDIAKIAPLYMLDQTWPYITLDAQPVWDNGQIGFAYITCDAARELRNPTVSYSRVLADYVKMYAQYVANEVYCVTVYEDNKVLVPLCEIYGWGAAELQADIFRKRFGIEKEE